MTIDCNLAGQPVTPGHERARLACGAIFVGGQNIRIRRIRAINFGTQGYGPQNPECFVIFSAAAHPDYNPSPFNCVIEDCIVEKPSENNTRETTCINMGSGENTNVIDLEAFNQILWRNIGSVRLFNNRTSAGKLLDGYDDLATQRLNDRARDVEDAWLVAW